MSAVTLIAHTEVGSGGASSITFSSIPGTYDDLWLLISARTDSATTGYVVGVQMNTDTATTNYSRTIITHQSSGTVASSRYAGGTLNYLSFGQMPGSSSTVSTFNSAGIYIPNYVTGSYYKQVIADTANENNSTTTYQQSLSAGLWAQTSAITQLVISPPGANFVQYSSATLYGVKKA